MGPRASADVFCVLREIRKQVESRGAPPLQSRTTLEEHISPERIAIMAKTKLPEFIVVTPSADGSVVVHYSGNDRTAAVAAFGANPGSTGCHLVKAGGFKEPKAPK